MKYENLSIFHKGISSSLLIQNLALSEIFISRVILVCLIMERAVAPRAPMITISNVDYAANIGHYGLRMKIAGTESSGKSIERTVAALLQNECMA